MQLQDRVAIITGAAQGVGAATAQELAREGAKVLMVDRDPRGADGAAALAAQLPERAREPHPAGPAQAGQAAPPL